MGNLAHKEGGFEFPAYWTLSANASIDSTPVAAYAGSKYLTMRSSRTGFGTTTTSRVDGTITVPPGRYFSLRFRYNAADVSATCALRFDLDTGSGYSPIFSTNIDPGADAWITVDAPGKFATPSTDLTMSLRLFLAAPSSPANNAVYIDGLEIEGGYYPPENGPRRTGETWHLDDIMGDMVPRHRITRDIDNRLRDAWDEDGMGRSDYRTYLPGEWGDEEP